MSKNLTDMVPVKWIKPGSRHHNVVHYVHQDLIHPTDTADQVIVFWPRKGKKEAEKWDAVLPLMPDLPHPSLSKVSCCVYMQINLDTCAYNFYTSRKFSIKARGRIIML